MLQLNTIEKMGLNVLKQGHIPEHVAFIMDGNRRFGKTKHNQSLSGHKEGANTLKKCLLYCLHLGVKYASFYAFSLQNYNRTQKQVEYLMNLARQQFKILSDIYEQDNILDLIEKNNVKVVIAGDLEGKVKTLFPDVRQGFLKIQERTKNNTKMTMFLCFAYDSIIDYNQALERKEQEKKQQRQRSQWSVDQERQKIFQKLMVPHYIDILIRTSGQSRLSNYMLMQVSYGMIYIQKNLWPSFNLLTLAKILLQYNYHYNDINTKKISFTEKKQNRDKIEKKVEQKKDE